MTGQRRAWRRRAQWKPLGRTRWTLGVYTWRRTSVSRYARALGSKVTAVHRGVVFRVGPLGHLQFQTYRTPSINGRVPRRSWQVARWGVRGRRRKRYVELSVGR